MRHETLLQPRADLWLLPQLEPLLELASEEPLLSEVSPLLPSAACSPLLGSSSMPATASGPPLLPALPVLLLVL